MKAWIVEQRKLTRFLTHRGCEWVQLGRSSGISKKVYVDWHCTSIGYSTVVSCIQEQRAVEVGLNKHVHNV